MIRPTIVAAALALALALPAAGEPQRAVPYSQGPDVPNGGSSLAFVTPFVDELWSYTEETRTRTVRVPTPPGPDTAWDRIVLVYSSRPEGDPWDRLFTVQIEGMEVLRGTTPRAAFTVRRDITEYSNLLPPGERVRVGTSLGSWVGALRSSVWLEFTAGDVQVFSPVQVPMHGLRGSTNGNASATQTSTLFPDEAPDGAAVEIFLSGHSPAGEFWYQYGGPPEFALFVDGTQIATLTAMPYTYAFIGCEPMSTCEPVHNLAWWTVQQAADKAGVHNGTGEIPPYRATLDAADLSLLRGARTVRVVQTNRRVLSGGSEYWPISVGFLLQGVTDNCPGVANPGQEDADADGVGDACDGPRAADATGARSGERDVVTATYPAGVTCDPETVDPSLFTYTDANAPVAATDVSCDGTDALELSFPAGTLRVNDDGLLRYTAAEDPEAGILVGGQAPAPNHTEPVAVT